MIDPEDPAMVKQILEVKEQDGSTTYKEISVQRIAYIPAVGDNLERWVVNICLDRNEMNVSRLNSILNVIDIWDQQFLFEH